MGLDQYRAVTDLLAEYGVPVIMDADFGHLPPAMPLAVSYTHLEAERVRPSALILTGDLTHNGEKLNHLELAEKLKGLQEKGVTVLVIPGNHDIKNPMAAVYFGGERERAEQLESGEDFYEIYREFGYDEAMARDSASLSYVYALDDTHWVMMLDSCQYEDKNHVGGRIREETLQWMEELSLIHI